MERGIRVGGGGIDGGGGEAIVAADANPREGAAAAASLGPSRRRPEASNRTRPGKRRASRRAGRPAVEKSTQQDQWLARKNLTGISPRSDDAESSPPPSQCEEKRKERNATHARTTHCSIRFAANFDLGLTPLTLIV